MHFMEIRDNSRIIGEVRVKQTRQGDVSEMYLFGLRVLLETG